MNANIPVFTCPIFREDGSLWGAVTRYFGHGESSTTATRRLDGAVFDRYFAETRVEGEFAFRKQVEYATIIANNGNA